MYSHFHLTEADEKEIFERYKDLKEKYDLKDKIIANRLGIHFSTLSRIKNKYIKK
jgi:DNA-directed RNA polymerase specialized sigma subunit